MLYSEGVERLKTRPKSSSSLKFPVLQYKLANIDADDSSVFAENEAFICTIIGKRILCLKFGIKELSLDYFSNLLDSTE